MIQWAEQLLRENRTHHIFFEENTVRMSKLEIKVGESQKLLRDAGYYLERLSKMSGMLN